MVRHCVVPSCKSTDLTNLCHRFPKRKKSFDQWRSALRLDHVDANLLMQRFVVCTLHFKASDYRNVNSRMLNAVAVPTLTHSDLKAAFYEMPTTTISVRKCERTNATETIVVERLVNSETESLAPEDRSASIERIEQMESLEALEEDSEEDIVYFIEEEVNPNEGDDVESNDDNTVTTDSPVDEEPDRKRKKPESPAAVGVVESKAQPKPEPVVIPAETLIPPTIVAVVAYQNSSVQTDDVEIVSEEDLLQRRMVQEFYPQYAGYSRLELAKQLKDREERLAELTKKLANFETAHAAMMKTMEAFKTLVN